MEKLQRALHLETNKIIDLKCKSSQEVNFLQINK